MPAAPTWNHKYTIQYTSENGELSVVNLSGKNATGDVELILAEENPFQKSHPNSEEDKFSSIRGSEAIIRFVVQDDSIGLDTFIGADDEWKVDYYKADMSVTNWQGFLVQDEHTRDMQDPPYIMELRAVDGIAWAKDESLVKPDGTEYRGLVFLLDIVGDILWRINPYLKLVTHVNVFHVSMDDRDIDPANDPWLQTKVEARTFRKDAISFEDSYTILEKILTAWGCELFQWNGAWHIVDLWDRMKGLTSFTTYSYNLSSPTDAHVRIVDGGEINVEYLCKIAPANSLLFTGPVFPVHEDQQIGLKFAVKSVQLTYNYVPWPELPLNNKFDRGTLYLPYSGTDHTAYIPADWQHGKVDASTGLPFALTATTKIAYSLRSLDAFGTEIKREIIIETPSGYGVNQEDWFRSEGIPVTIDDKISISFQWRTAPNWPDINTPVPVHVYVVNSAGTTYYGLEEKPSADSHGKWKLNDPAGIYAENPGGDWTVYGAYSSESQPIPVTGTLYIVFAGQRSSNTSLLQYFSDFTFSYLPFVAGGYRQVEGDYNLIGQSATFKQKTTQEIFLSDSIHGVLRGAMYRFSNVDGWVLTTPGWYRYGVTESRRFGEIQALKRFWHTYRAMQKIEGTFSGLIFFGVTELPIGLLQLFDPEFMGQAKKYMLTSIDENHKSAEWKGTLIEVGTEDDAAITIDTNTFNYIFGDA
jgi:hypothetical protein